MFPIYIDLCVGLKHHEISIVHFRMFIHFMHLKCIFIGSHVGRFHGCSFYLFSQTKSCNVIKLHVLIFTRDLLSLREK